jgi:hypothetical protein
MKEIPSVRIRRGTLLNQETRIRIGQSVARSLTASGQTPDPETLAKKWLDT